MLSATVKITVTEPIPSASASTAVKKNARSLTIERSPESETKQVSPDLPFPLYISCLAIPQCDILSFEMDEALLPLSPQVFHILVALAERDQHGYGIMQDVAARTGGKLRLSAGTLYGSIKRLLAQGLVVELRERERPRDADDDPRRRYYRLTTLGRKVAKAEAARMAELLEQAKRNGLLAKRS